MVYGAEAVLPSDILHDAPRVSAYNEVTADEAQQLSVDLLEEERNLADQRSAIYQQKLRRYHSRRVRQRSFKEGDLVLRLRQEAAHKLASPWEGPFIISKALHNGSYYLIDTREIKDRKANFWKNGRGVIRMTYTMRQSALGTLHSYVLSTLSTLCITYIVIVPIYDQ